jgi:hypothetical protein
MDNRKPQDPVATVLACEDDNLVGDLVPATKHFRQLVGVASCACEYLSEDRLYFGQLAAIKFCNLLENATETNHSGPSRSSHAIYAERDIRHDSLAHKPGEHESIGANLRRSSRALDDQRLPTGTSP